MATGHNTRGRRTHAPQHRKASFPTGGWLAGYLERLASTLEAAYSTSVTVQAALDRQNSEQDQDIALCLRLHVSEVVSREAEELRFMVRHRIRSGTRRLTKP